MMFALQETALDPEALKHILRHDSAGACATFEGWVRNHNEGQSVDRLEYEAYTELATQEGQRILNEAREKFGLTHAHCEHRVGLLEIGDMAVWIGVSAAHRGEAFAACRFIIDEVKQRVPIWKKEHYTAGDSGWVNCERCAHPEEHDHGATHGITEGAYYDRQIRLAEVGPEGQEKLREARVLIIGAGGLGCPASLYLAAAGVGHIGLCDGDRLEASNLHRQPIYGHEDVGKSKAALAADRLRALNPFIEITTHEARLCASNVEDLFAGYTLVLDCTDNFETKFLINDAAVLTKTPAIFASIYQYEGQIQLYNPDSATPCLRCLWPEIPEACVGSCAEVGVLGAVPGIAGAMEAMEALKFLLDLPGQLGGEIVLCNFLTHANMPLACEPATDCPVCGSGSITVLDRSAYEPPDDLEVDFVALSNGASNNFTVVDIREHNEAAALRVDVLEMEHIPASAIDMDIPPFAKDKAYVLCCARGVRSRHLARVLRKRGYDQVYSLSGGLAAVWAVQTVRP
jgi:adenylyltransferase/sulfurtransferase